MAALENIKRRLDFVISESEQITKHFDQSVRSEIFMFCMCMLDRLNFSSEGLQLLLNQFEQKTKLDYSCGIIIRSVLLDYLILLNAMEIMGRNSNNPVDIERELKNYCLSALCDSVRHTINNIEIIYSDANPKKIQMYRNLVKENPECFEPFDSIGKPTFKCQPARSIQKLFYTLRDSPQFKGYASTYDAYSFYSKYDHFGQMYYHLSRRKAESQLENVNQAIQLFPKVLLWTLVLLEGIFHTDPFIKEKRNSVALFIDDFERA